MVIFHSYVSLPEGNIGIWSWELFCFRGTWFWTQQWSGDSEWRWIWRRWRKEIGCQRCYLECRNNCSTTREQAAWLTRWWEMSSSDSISWEGFKYMNIYIYPLYVHVVKTRCTQFDCLNPPITVSGDHHLRWRSALKFFRSSRDAKNALLSACSAGCDGTGPMKK